MLLEAIQKILQFLDYASIFKSEERLSTIK